MEYATDPAWARYQAVPQPYLRRHAEEFIGHYLESEWSIDPFWSIEFQGRSVGAFSMHVFANDRTASVGFDLAPFLWGRGLTTEAAMAVVKAAFDELELRKVCATTDAPNAASIRVLEKLGMRREGLQREHHWRRDKPVDIALYGVLREDWTRPRDR